MQTIKPQELNLRLTEVEKEIGRLRKEDIVLEEKTKLLFANFLKLKGEIQEIRRFLGEKFGTF